MNMYSQKLFNVEFSIPSIFKFFTVFVTSHPLVALTVPVLLPLEGVGLGLCVPTLQETSVSTGNGSQE